MKAFSSRRHSNTTDNKAYGKHHQQTTDEQEESPGLLWVPYDIRQETQKV
jgi:hypothetical protein